METVMPSWDLVVYLLLTHCLGWMGWISAVKGDRISVDRIVLLYPVLLCGVWVFWGGYGIDGWRYLMGFWGDRLRFESEQLFWLAGTALSRLTSDPWPLKILAAAGVLGFCTSIIIYYRERPRTCLVLGLALVPLLPAFFLTYGNALRQGLGASAAMLGAIFLIRERVLVFVLFSIMAFLLHQTSVVIALAMVAARLVPGLIFLALLFCPIMSFAAAYVAQFYEIRLADHIRYAHYTEGMFHYVKFGVVYALAWTFAIRARNWPRDVRTMAVGYSYVVAASTVLLKYEVPFERFVLYSDFFLPFIVPLLLLGWIAKRKLMIAAWLTSLIAGVALWSHKSIVTSIGLMAPATG